MPYQPLIQPRVEPEQQQPAPPAKKPDESYMAYNPYDMYAEPKPAPALAGVDLGMSGSFDIDRDDTYGGSRFQSIAQKDAANLSGKELGTTYM